MGLPFPQSGTGQQSRLHYILYTMLRFCSGYDRKGIARGHVSVLGFLCFWAEVHSFLSWFQSAHGGRGFSQCCAHWYLFSRLVFLLFVFFSLCVTWYSCNKAVNCSYLSWHFGFSQLFFLLAHPGDAGERRKLFSNWTARTQLPADLKPRQHKMVSLSGDSLKGFESDVPFISHYYKSIIK